MRTTSAALIGLFLLGPLAHGQVLIDKSLVLEGATDTERQVTGLPNSLAPTSVLTAGAEQSGAHRIGGDVGGSGAQWQTALPSLTGALVPGTNLSIQTPAASTGAVQLQVNDQGLYPVVLEPGSPLMGDAYPIGTMLSLVFDGDQFQVMNGRATARRECPSDMASASTQFCIERNERPSAQFWDAMITCATAGRRLCTWGELYTACIAAAPLGLNNMTGNWEWSNNAANQDTWVRVALRASCTEAGTRQPTDTPTYSRCCISR